jgi:hypothetical protein
VIRQATQRLQEVRALVRCVDRKAVKDPVVVLEVGEDSGRVLVEVQEGSGLAVPDAALLFLQPGRDRERGRPPPEERDRSDAAVQVEISVGAGAAWADQVERCPLEVGGISEEGTGT